MQFTTFFGENRTLAFILAAVCLLIGVALVFILFRIVFGRGIKLPGGRGRQQRLGIVDAFEIDRQRQLVIVRRDNVEHLIMIGGPNDVVIESTIIRAEAREGRPPREREPGTNGLSWPAAPSAETPAQPEAMPAAARGSVPEPPPPPIPSAPRPPAPPPVSPPAPPAGEALLPEAPAVEPSAAAPSPRPSRPPPPPLRPLGTGDRPTLTPRPLATPLRREPRPLPAFLANRAKPLEPAGPPAAPEAAEPAASASTPAPETPPPPPPEQAAAAVSEPAPAAEQPTQPPRIELDPLESLEEEMAKLLGRNPNEKT